MLCMINITTIICDKWDPTDMSCLYSLNRFKIIYLFPATDRPMLHSLNYRFEQRKYCLDQKLPKIIYVRARVIHSISIHIMSRNLYESCACTICTRKALRKL